MTQTPASPGEPPPSETTSLDLWLDLSSGRQRSLEYFHSLRALLVRRLRNHPQYRLLAEKADPEDVVQEVWLRTLRPGALDSFEHRGRGSLRSYLLRILDSTVTDLLRRHAAQKRGGDSSHFTLGPSSDGDAPPLEVPSPDPTPTQDARASELACQFEESLDERELEVWNLSEHQGLTFEEIARRMNTSSAAVRGVLHRARRRFIDGGCNLRSEGP